MQEVKAVEAETIYCVASWYDLGEPPIAGSVENAWSIRSKVENNFDFFTTPASVGAERICGWTTRPGPRPSAGRKATGAVVRTIGIVRGTKIGLMNLVDNMSRPVERESRGEHREPSAGGSVLYWARFTANRPSQRPSAVRCRRAGRECDNKDVAEHICCAFNATGALPLVLKTMRTLDMSECSNGRQQAELL
jgi:hypothetical protein